MATNPLIRKYPKKVNTPQPNKSAGILDDYAVRKVIATKEGSITRTPTDDIDITNKLYVDTLTTDHPHQDVRTTANPTFNSLKVDGNVLFKDGTFVYDTVTADINANFDFNKNSTKQASLRFINNGNVQWVLRARPSSGATPDFQIRRFKPLGTGVDNPILIRQTDGVVEMLDGIDVGGATHNMQVSSSGDLVFNGNNSGLPYGTISVVSNANETTITTQNVYVQIVNFDTNGVNNNSTPDHTNDHITITKAGDYKIECCITANSVAGAGATFEFEVKKNNGASRVGSAHGDRTLSGGGSEAGSITICTIATLAVNDTIELWTKNESNTQNIIIEDASLSVLQVGG